MLGAGVVLSFIAQICEQNDILRFMPTRTEDNKRAWWTAVILAGPGWVLLAVVKQCGRSDGRRLVAAYGSAANPYRRLIGYRT
jgi:hypothetical protein